MAPAKLVESQASAYSLRRRVRWDVHVKVVSLAVVSVGAGVAFQVLGEGQAFGDAARSFLRYLTIYAALHATLLTLEFWFRSNNAPGLRVYYRFWVRPVYTSLAHWLERGDGSWVGRIARRVCRDPVYRNSVMLIAASWDDELRMPLVVWRRHLFARHRLPEWAFAIVLLLDPARGPVIRRLPKKDTLRLEVDLRDQSLGVYNSRGKRFLREHFPSTAAAPYIRQAGAIDAFMRMQSSDQQMTLLPPFRWASGGGIGIAKLDKRKWVCVFFRDVHPIGWNIANGASERRDEYKTLHRLMLREFCEELVILDRRPEIDDPSIYQRRLFALKEPVVGEILQGLQEDLFSRTFTDEHDRIRGRDDGLSIRASPRPVCLKPVETHHLVRVTFHTDTGTDWATLGDLVFSVNPGENGVEVIRFFEFDLAPRDYLMCGEVGERGRYLVREPVGLLSLDWLQDQFRQGDGSLGDVVWHDDYGGGKLIPKIPKSEYRLYTADIRFRSRRLTRLREVSKGTTFEITKHQSWLASYERLFNRIDEQGGEIVDDCLRVLCPVTWRSLEALFRGESRAR